MSETQEYLPLNKRQHLPFWQMMCIAAATLSPPCIYPSIFSLFEPISSELGLSDLAKALLLFYGSLAGFVIAPVLGVLSDGLMFKYGRRRIFIFIGGQLLTFGFILLTFTHEIGKFLGGVTGAKAVFIISIIILFTAVNIVQAPARTLCSDLTPPAQQNMMSNICQVYGGLGGTIFNLIGGIKLYELFNASIYKFLPTVSFAFSSIAILITCIVAKEERLQEKPSSSNPFKEIWRNFKTMPVPFKKIVPPLLLGSAAAYEIGIHFSNFMGIDVFHGRNGAGATLQEIELYDNGVSWSLLCNTVNCAVQFIYGFGNVYLCNLIGIRFVMIIGMILFTISFLFYFGITNKYAFLFIVIPFAIGNVILFSLPYTIVALCTPAEDRGANFGILNTIIVIGQQIANFTIGRGYFNVDSKYPIAFSFIFSVLAAIFSYYIIEPKETDEYTSIDDNQKLLDSIAVDIPEPENYPI